MQDCFLCGGVALRKPIHPTTFSVGVQCWGGGIEVPGLELMDLFCDASCTAPLICTTGCVTNVVQPHVIKEREAGRFC